MQYQIKELSVGGILDQTVNLIKNHFNLLFGIVAASYLPLGLIQGLVTNSMLPSLPEAPTEQDIIVFQESVAKVGLIMGPISIFLGLIVYPIINAAVIDAVSRCYLGLTTSIGNSFSHAVKILFPLLGTWFLQMLALVGGFILLIVPFFIFFFWFFLATHAVVIGGESGRAALARSRKLMRGNVITLCGLGLVLFGIQLGIGLCSGLVVQEHATIILQSVLQSISFVFSTVALVVFYFSCRCKNENFDLTLLAEDIGVEGSEEPELAM